MDLLKTLVLYMTMIFASSVQTMPDAESFMVQYNTPEPTAVVTPAPVITPSPTPVPTIAISPNPEHKTLQVGDKGDEVLRLQQALTDYGYYDGDLDGRYGNQTRYAVERFQYNHGLVADGIAGKHTLTVLYDSNQVRPAEPTPSPTPEGDSLSIALPRESEAPQRMDTPAPTAAPEVTQQPEEVQEDASAEAPSADTTSAEETDGQETTEPTGDADVQPSEADAPVAAEEENTPEAGQTPEGEPASEEESEPEQTSGEETADAPADETAPAQEAQQPDQPGEAVPEAAEEPAADPVFGVMEGWQIHLVDPDQLLTATDEGEAAPSVLPCQLGETVFIPLLPVLEGEGVFVIASDDSVEKVEIGFALGDHLYRLVYTEDQAGQPTGLEAYCDETPVPMENREAYSVDGTLYLPVGSVTAVTGMTFERDDSAQVLRVYMPSAE